MTLEQFAWAFIKSEILYAGERRFISRNFPYELLKRKGGQLLHEFVDKIVVRKADKSSGHRIQRIDVHYNFIGEIDFSPEYCG